MLGALLVGAGVVSLVAWHWEEMGRALKLALIVAAVVGAHLAGDALRRTGRHPRLGEAVALLGSLLFGAGIAMVAQIFQVSGAWYGIFGGFAAGALAAGLLLETTPTLTAAAVAGGAIWASGFSMDHPGHLATLVPWATAAPFLAAGWWRRSPPLLAVAAVGLGLSAGFSVGGDAWALPPLLLGVALLALPLLGAERDAPLTGALASAGRLGFEVVAYALSFASIARELRLESLQRYRHIWRGAGIEALVPPLFLAVPLLALGLLRRRGGTRALASEAAAGLAAVAILAGAIVPSPQLVAWAANLALAALAVLRLVEGLSTLRRAPFWEGLAVGALLLISRFLEIEHLLWLKGLGFIGCGVLVTWGAVRFERARKEVRHA